MQDICFHLLFTQETVIDSLIDSLIDPLRESLGTSLVAR